MVSELRALWDANFEKPPSVLTKAPGRVNLIGEHTDYNEGFVLPAAIDRHVYGMFRLAYGSSRLISGTSGEAPPFVIGRRAEKSWVKYAAAVAMALLDIGLEPKPLEGVIVSDLPGSSGLSSSAALELCFVSAWNALCDFGLTNLEMAQVAWRAETEYVGVKCGMMDQLAVALGRAGHALYIDARSGAVEAVPLPPNLTIAVLNTRKSRALAAGSYNDRVAECAAAVAKIRLARPEVKSLRDASFEDLASLDGIELRRARHVVSENQRVFEFRKALIQGDIRALGVLAQASHASLRDDYEVSCPELDAMVEAARRAPGCVAVRMTGAGFGGCCVALVEGDLYPEFETETISRYGEARFASPDLFPTAASDGISVHL